MEQKRQETVAIEPDLPIVEASMADTYEGLPATVCAKLCESAGVEMHASLVAPAGEARNDDPTTCMCGKDGNACSYPDCQDGAYHPTNSYPGQKPAFLRPECHTWKPITA